MAEHSPLGASSAYRWMACPGSVALSEGLPSRPSVHAAKGTAAHAVNERCLRHGTQPRDYLGTRMLYEGFEVEITEADVRACELFVDYVRTAVGATGTLHVEARVALPRIDRRCWGTADAVIWQPAQARLIVADYKHGAGHFVPVEGNSQLRYYALGALLSFPYRAQSVRVVIVQPNIEREGAEPIRSEEFEAVALLDFAADLKEAVRRADREPHTYVPGEHCAYCPGQAVCPALVAKAHELAVEDFTAIVPAYTPEQIAQFLDWLPRIKSWARAVELFAYAELTAGRPIPGYKLVDKRGRRVWADAPAVADALAKAGVAPDEIYERKLRSPAQLEERLGKAALKSLRPYMAMHSTGVTVAREGDRRDAVDPIALDFAPVSHASCDAVKKT